MKTIGDKLEAFSVTGVKPGFNQHEENGVSAFETITEKSFPASGRSSTSGRRTSPSSARPRSSASTSSRRSSRSATPSSSGGSTDNEFSKLGWRRDHKDLSKLGHWSFGDSKGSLVDQLGIRDKAEGVALRATFIVDPDNTIQHVSVNNLNVGRNPEEVLRILDGLQTDELCPCNRTVGGETL
jgi:peroxiredoxin (alkyl hydroperoxide reductase subunit C)